MSRTIQTRLGTAHANTSESITAAGTRCAAALTTLTSNRHSPTSILQFRGFPARESSTPTRRAPGAFIEEVSDDQEDYVPSDDGPGDDGPNGNDPDGDDPGDDDPEPHNDDEEGEPINGLPSQDDAGMIIFNNLSIAIDRLACSAWSSNSSSSCTKVRKPNTFNGTDPKKLCTFFVQCEPNFQDWLKAFRTDRAKVIFTQSYLKGMALKWFEPDLLGMEDPNARPLWMTSWREFIIELQTTFGPHNPIANAEHQLNHLCMKDTHCVNRYVVDFNWIASQVRGYSDGALHHHFYSGLPDRIKDEISRIGKLHTLDSLWAVAQEIDAWYWECKEEVAHQNKTSTSTSTNTNTNTTSKSSGKSEKSKLSLGNSAQSSSSLNLTPKKSGKTPELLDKLRKDGKLTSEERKHRFEQNLCMFCGGSGHKAKECPKSGSQAAKARSATTTMTTMLEAKPMASTEAKK